MFPYLYPQDGRWDSRDEGRTAQTTLKPVIEYGTCPWVQRTPDPRSSREASNTRTLSLVEQCTQLESGSPVEQ